MKVTIESMISLYIPLSPFDIIYDSKKSKVTAISTSDCECAYDIHCSSYKVLKDIIYGMIGKEDDTNDERTDGS